MEPPAPDRCVPPALPKWAWAALLAAIAFVYLHGVASFPLRWEEPRALPALVFLTLGILPQ